MSSFTVPKGSLEAIKEFILGILLSLRMKRERSPGVFLSKELDNLIKKVGPNHKFSKWINDMADVLLENKFAGDLIKKSQIPKVYVEKYRVFNLYRYSHSEGHRSCYTILEDKCPHILDLLSHSEYDKIFGYDTT